MSGDDVGVPPAVIWAQRSSAILLTICLEDCKKPNIKINPDSLEFSGNGGPDQKLHKLTINFFEEIDTEKSIYSARPRNIEFVIKKKEEGPFWPRLTKEKVKHHWLKVDFNRWRDEDDESEDEGMGGLGGGNEDLEEIMKQMGGLRGEEGKPNMDDINDGEADSDDGDLPDLE